MMLITTGAIAAITLVLLWFLAIKLIPWAWASYLIVAAVGFAFLYNGSVHFMYIGIEVIGFGALLVWARHRSKRPPSDASPWQKCFSGAPTVLVHTCE